MLPFKEQFLSSEQGQPRVAVKRLTGAIEREMVKLTINAQNWYAPHLSSLLLYLTSTQGNSIRSSHGS